MIEDPFLCGYDGNLCDATYRQDVDEVKALIAKCLKKNPPIREYLLDEMVRKGVVYDSPPVLQLAFDMGGIVGERLSAYVSHFRNGLERANSKHVRQTLEILLTQCINEGKTRYTPEYGELVQLLSGNCASRQSSVPLQDYLPVAISLGIPQHDIAHPQGLLALINPVVSAKMFGNYRKIMQLARQGIDFTPLFRLPDEKLATFGFGDYLPKCGWPEIRQEILVPCQKDGLREMQALFMNHPPGAEDLLHPGGTPREHTWHILGTGLSCELFSPLRWKGHEAEALSLANRLLKSLPEWRRTQVEKEIDFIALRRQCPAPDIGRLVAMQTLKHRHYPENRNRP